MENKKNIIFYCDNGTIICDLNNKKYTVKSFLYERIAKQNFVIAKKKNYKKKLYDENNNMLNVIKDFVKNKKNNNNFKLTQKINMFLKTT